MLSSKKLVTFCEVWIVISFSTPNVEKQGNNDTTREIEPPLNKPEYLVR